VRRALIVGLGNSSVGLHFEATEISEMGKAKKTRKFAQMKRMLTPRAVKQ
jgi:hypothetical protein